MEARMEVQTEAQTSPTKAQMKRQMEVQMEGHLKLFWELGYAVIPGVIPTKVVASVMAVVERFKYDPIFASVFGEGFDERRCQAQFPTELCKSLRNLQMYVRRKILAPAAMEWDAQQWVVLKSLAGDGDQEPHRDFPSNEIARARASTNTIQASLMVGLMPNTRLIVFDECFGEADIRKRRVLEFGPGDVVIFRGDLVHAEASYEAINYRIHTTLTVKGVKWKKNVTEAAPFKTFKCKYCAFLANTICKVRNHIRFCEDNPKKDEIVSAYKNKNAKGGTCEFCHRHFDKYNSMIKHRKRCSKRDITI